MFNVSKAKRQHKNGIQKTIDNSEEKEEQNLIKKKY